MNINQWGICSDRRIEKVCTVCGKEYSVILFRKNSKFCSRKCFYSTRSGIDQPQFIHIKGVRSNTGTTHFTKGHIPANWLGDDAGYNAFHKWIYRKLGKAYFCCFCGDPESKRYEWANISGEYKRNTNDWMSLCASCHRRYDSQRRKNGLKNRRFTHG